MSAGDGPRAVEDRPGDASGRSWSKYTALYLAVVLIATLPGLGATGMLGMEAMIADMATTVLETREGLVTRLYGELHTYKPPFVYWLSAAALGVAGRSELAFRLPAAFATVGMGLAILFLVGRATRPRTGCLAALAATTTGLLLQEAKQGEFDAILAAAVGVAVAAACHNLAVEPARRSAGLWALCYLALTAGVLTKGGLALMAFGPALLLAALLTRELRQLFHWGHLLAAALFVAIVAGYLWALYRAVGPAAFEQPLEEAGRRSLQWTLEAVGTTLGKPAFITAAFLPWSLAWFWSWRPAGTDAGTAVDRALWRMSLAGLGFLVGGVLTYMAVPTHHTRYYVPLAAAGGIVAACGLERLASRPSRLAERLAFGLAALVATLAVALGFLAETGLGGRVATALAGVAAFAAVWRLARSSLRYRVAWSLLAAAFCFWSAETWVLRFHRAALRDLSPIARELQPDVPEGEFVWAFGAAEPVGDNGSLYYYLERKVRTIREGEPLPAPGALVVATPAQLAELPPESRSRLDQVRRVEHPWSVFLLLRVIPPGASPGRPD